MVKQTGALKLFSRATSEKRKGRRRTQYIVDLTWKKLISSELDGKGDET